MKENKDFQIKFRLTASQKQAIEEYCQAHCLSTSEFLRMAANELLNKNGGYKNDK